MKSGSLNKNYCYAAFLRGINVGGNAVIKMDDLKNAFEDMCLLNVRTILAGGNVVFETGRKDIGPLGREIESGLEKAFGKRIDVMLRAMQDLKKLQESEPFAGIEAAASIRQYVTFLSGKTAPRSIKIPYSSALGEFRIIRATATEVISVLDLSKGKGTTELMSLIEKEYGSNVTTRSWNTILKVLK